MYMNSNVLLRIPSSVSEILYSFKRTRYAKRDRIIAHHSCAEAHTHLLQRDAMIRGSMSLYISMMHSKLMKSGHGHLLIIEMK